MLFLTASVIYRVTGFGRGVSEENCPPQARRAERILSRLTEEEHAVFRRGRNAHVHSVPQNASRSEYQEATALEALLGYLYLLGRRERINELFNSMMEEDETAEDAT